MDLQQHYPNLYALAHAHNGSNLYAQCNAIRTAAAAVLANQAVPLAVANQMCAELQQLNHEALTDFMFPLWAEISRKSPHDKHFNDVFMPELYDWLITLDGFKLVGAALSAPDYDLLAHINALPVGKVGLETLYYAVFARALEVFSTAVYYPADKRQTRADLGGWQYNLTAMVVRYMHPYWGVVLPPDPPTLSQSVRQLYTDFLMPLVVYPSYPHHSPAYRQTFEFWQKSNMLDLSPPAMTQLCGEPPSLAFIGEWIYRQMILCQVQAPDDLHFYAMFLYRLLDELYTPTDVIDVLHVLRVQAYQSGQAALLEVIDDIIKTYWHIRHQREPGLAAADADDSIPF